MTGLYLAVIDREYTFYDFFLPTLDTVHLPCQFHLVGCFQFFDYPFHLLHLTDEFLSDWRTDLIHTGSQSLKMQKHPCPSCCAVAQHQMDRGACVYCRLLSVLLMQIIKFGGKLVVNPRCSSIERHDFKRSKANFYVLLLNRLHRGDVARTGSVIVRQTPTTSTK